MAKVLRRLGIDLSTSRGTKNVMVIDSGRANRAANGDINKDEFTAKLIKSIRDSIAKTDKLNAATAGVRDDEDEDEDAAEKDSSSKVKKELKKPPNVMPVRRGGKSSSGYLIEDGEEEEEYEDEDFADGKLIMLLLVFMILVHLILTIDIVTSLLYREQR